jgi:hypothetical protein
MTTLHEAAQKALDALENRCGTHAEERGPDGAITALRTALAKQLAEQEPVACLVETQKGVMVWPIEDYNVALTYCDDGQLPIKLYTSPQPRRNVTYVCPACHFSLERQE